MEGETPPCRALERLAQVVLDSDGDTRDYITVA